MLTVTRARPSVTFGPAQLQVQGRLVSPLDPAPVLELIVLKAF